MMLDYRVVMAAEPEGGNVCSRNSLSRGDPEGAFAGCERLFERVYTTEMVHQAYLEPHASIGQYNPDGSYTVHSTTQGTFGQMSRVRRETAPRNAPRHPHTRP